MLRIMHACISASRRFREFRPLENPVLRVSLRLSSSIYYFYSPLLSSASSSDLLILFHASADLVTKSLWSPIWFFSFFSSLNHSPILPLSSLARLSTIALNSFAFPWSCHLELPFFFCFPHSNRALFSAFYCPVCLLSVRRPALFLVVCRFLSVFFQFAWNRFLPQPRSALSPQSCLLSFIFLLSRFAFSFCHARAIYSSSLRILLVLILPGLRRFGYLPTPQRTLSASALRLLSTRAFRDFCSSICVFATAPFSSVCLFFSLLLRHGVDARPLQSLQSWSTYLKYLSVSPFFLSVVSHRRFFPPRWSSPRFLLAPARRQGFAFTLSSSIAPPFSSFSATACLHSANMYSLYSHPRWVEHFMRLSRYSSY